MHVISRIDGRQPAPTCLELSDWVNPLGLPPEATSAIELHPGDSAGVVVVGVLIVARVSLERFAARVGSGPGVWMPGPARGDCGF